MTKKNNNRNDLEHQNKSKFVLDILDYSLKKKVDDKTKERLINLIGIEIEKTGNVGGEIIERLERIEGMMSNKSKSSIIEKKPSFLKPHKPNETYLLLDSFSSNEAGMKNLTHTFNYEFIDYDTFINKCKEEFEQGKIKYPNVPEALLTRIDEFAFSTQPRWYIRKGEKKIEPKLGWSEPDFVKWYKENKRHPGNDAKYNQEMIIPFKESIQVRADTGNLIKLIDDIKEIVFGNNSICEVNIDYEKIKSAQFYTDVDNLGQAIFHIFSSIKDISTKNFCNEIDVDYNDTEGFKTIFITHIDSTPSKNSDDKDFLGGNLKSIRSNLWGLCNYEILAKFPNGYFRKIIATDNENEFNKVFSIENDSIVKGFTHVLKFY